MEGNVHHLQTNTLHDLVNLFLFMINTYINLHYWLIKDISKIFLGIDYCCCGDACCWDKCRYEMPPVDCLQSIPNSQWIYSEELGYFQAFKGMYIFESFIFLIHNWKKIFKKTIYQFTFEQMIGWYRWNQSWKVILILTAPSLNKAMLQKGFNIGHLMLYQVSKVINHRNTNFILILGKNFAF